MTKKLILFLILLTAPLMATAAPKVLVLGDSLSAAYGIRLDDGWVALLQQRIRDEGMPHEVVNAAVSGETTAGGLGRLPELLERHDPVIVLLQLGGNDGLRGQPLARLEQNLERMVEKCRAHGAEPVLFEMMIPTNYGAAYTQGFTRTFHSASERMQVALVPFLLAEIAADEDHFLDDGIHPDTAAQPLLLDAVWPHVEPLLRASGTTQSRK